MSAIIARTGRIAFADTWRKSRGGLNRTASGRREKRGVEAGEDVTQHLVQHEA
jgi:hypothetical protein